jgi:phosphoglycolate phosphatase-like HAD superfamily hydrolase
MQKLEAAKLNGYFKEIRAVPAKRKEDLLALFSDMGFSPRNSWVVGGSVSSDVNPALEAGANCILYVPRHPRHVGAHENTGEPAGPIFRIHELADARAILAKPAAKAS